MPIITWDATMSVGNAKIDRQHQELVRIINQLGDAMQQGNANQVIGKIIDELVTYTVFHFGEEERMFAATAYPHTDAHKDKHRFLVDKVQQVKTDFAAGKVAIGVPLLHFLREWLVEHIMKTDKTYSSYLP